MYAALWIWVYYNSRYGMCLHGRLPRSIHMISYQSHLISWSIALWRLHLLRITARHRMTLVSNDICDTYYMYLIFIIFCIIQERMTCALKWCQNHWNSIHDIYHGTNIGLPLDAIVIWCHASRQVLISGLWSIQMPRHGWSRKLIPAAELCLINNSEPYFFHECHKLYTKVH